VDDCVSENDEKLFALHAAKKKTVDYKLSIHKITTLEFQEAKFISSELQN